MGGNQEKSGIKKSLTFRQEVRLSNNCGSNRIRTYDPLLVRQML